MTALLESAFWISPEEYLGGERLADVKHEYVAGRVYAMGGASADHGRIVMNIEDWAVEPCRLFDGRM